VRLLVKIVTCVVVPAVWLAPAVAAGTPNVTVTVRAPSPTSRVVHIVNHDTVAYSRFVVQSIRAPKIIAATGRCVVEKDLGFNGTTSTWRYRAKCNKRLVEGRHSTSG
jgi:hypothetical protein